MPVRDVSIEAYEQLVQSGEMTRREASGARLVAEFGPATVNEIFKKSGLRYGTSQSNLNSTITRLRERGVVRELEKRPCTVTGRMAYVYEATGEPPVVKHRADKTECPTCGGRGYIEQGRLL